MKRNQLYAAVAALSLAAGSAALAEGPSTTTDPGFVPQTGQINPGHAPKTWTATPALPQDRQPAQDAARAALMMPDPVGVSSLGEGPAPQNATDQQTTGTASPTPAAPPGPIGATLQTMPALVSQRNDLLDHLPVMAWPLPLNDQQRRQIYHAAMARPTQSVAGLDKLKPASSLSFAQAGHLSSLPPDVASIDGLQGLQYVTDKHRVLLVRPSTGIVVDEITM